MPSFNGLAQAALTPGGAQAGVNDLVQAIIMGQVAKKKQADADAERQYQHGRDSSDDAFREKSLGARTANDLAEQGIRRDTNTEVARHNAADESNNKYRTDANEANGMFRTIGGLGQSLIRALSGGGSKGAQGYHGNPAAITKMQHEIALERANARLYGRADGNTWDTQHTTDFLNQPITKQVHHNATPDEIAKLNQYYAEEIAKQQGADPALGRGPTPAPTPGQSMGAKLSDPNASQGFDWAPQAQPGQAAPNSAIDNGGGVDYDAEDARLQSSDPNYRAMRANPDFDWHKAIDDNR